MLLPCRASSRISNRPGRGKIIVLSGGGATNPLPNISAYAASKAAVVRLMETLAEELQAFHVDVNAIAPGALATRLRGRSPGRRPGESGPGLLREEPASGRRKAPRRSTWAPRLAVYLASAESDGITGKLISAQWDPWPTLHEHREELAKSDIYCLRRIVPEDRGKSWGIENCILKNANLKLGQACP